MMVTWESFARTDVLFHIMGINVNKNAIAVERNATMLPVVHLQVTTCNIFMYSKINLHCFYFTYDEIKKILNDF